MIYSLTPGVDPLPVARRVYRHLFNTSLPKKWTVVWNDRLTKTAAITYEKPLWRIEIATDWQAPLASLVHELIHVRHPKLKHGKLFSDLERTLCLYLGPLVWKEEQRARKAWDNKEAKKYAE